MVCDLSYRESVKFTYERDGGLVHSWIDHVMCSESLSSRITDVHSVSSGANMSDHLPLSFQLHIPCASINTSFETRSLCPSLKGTNMLQTAQTTVLLLSPLVSVRSWRELSSPSTDHTLQLVPFSLVLNQVIQLHCAPLP